MFTLRFLGVFLLAFCSGLAIKEVHSAGAFRSVLDNLTGGSGNSNVRANEVKDANCGQYRLDTNTTYRIQSPLSQLGFPIFTIYQCTWKFYGTEGCIPVITCPTFDLPQSNNCTSSGMEVTDGLTKTETFCGTSGPNNVTAGNAALSITYRSSIAPPSRGFSCLVSCAAESTQLTQLANTLPPPNRANCTCGVPGTDSTTSVNRIVGGTDAPPVYWKWQAILLPKTRKTPFCGGTLINDRYILTAAHCIVTTGLMTFPSAADIVLNEYNIKNTTETVIIRRGIIDAVPHPFYNPVTQDYDFGLIRFAEPIDLVANEAIVTPVCLPALNTRDTFAGLTGTATGFGTLSEGGDPANILQQADIPIITNDECNQSEKYDGKITPRMLCAGYPNGGIDACQGDSGGPFVLNKNGRYTKVGVTSFGQGCARAQKPGVYSRVTEVNEWIRQVAQAGTWCNE